MKKILSLVLAVIMLLSIMPMAYAQRATYSPEIEEYIKDYIRAYAYCNSAYESYEKYREVKDMFIEAGTGITDVYPSYENLINIDEGRLAELAVCHETIKKVIDEIEGKIADGEIVVVIDTYEWFNNSFRISAYYGDKEWYELIDRAENFSSEKYINAKNECEISVKTAEEIVNCEQLYTEYYTHTQAEFDAAVAKMKPFCDLMIACLDGNHPYGEYVSNNDATEEADGTKTATCEFCGATDTITDEGTKLVKEEEPNEEPTEEKVSFFEMIFALIKEFFEKIFSIFK